MANAPETDDQVLGALVSLRDLLLEERAALAARDHKAILDCADRKAVRAVAFHALAGLGDAPDSRPELRGRMLALARECDRLNRANGVTVVALRGVTDRALSVLHGRPADAETVVYGPGGTQRATGTGRYAGSA